MTITFFFFFFKIISELLPDLAHAALDYISNLEMGVNLTVASEAV